MEDKRITAEEILAEVDIDVKQMAQRIAEATQTSLDHLTWENPLGEARKDALRIG